ncbi:MAG: signal peptidase II [Alphaproteobacteria bacterium]|nr:signal peptidase II [Alphaproteobacteria bacterium]
MYKVFFFGLAAVFFIADQISKWAVTERFIRPALGGEYGESLSLGAWLMQAPALLPPVQIPVLPFFNIVMVWNRGVSFGLFNTHTDYGPLALGLLSVAIIIVFSVWLLRSQSRLQRLSIALVIGGALGNVMDRIRFGAVVDFLDFHAFGIHFPAFNISDSCICIGVFLLIIESFFFEKAGKGDKQFKAISNKT